MSEKLDWIERTTTKALLQRHENAELIAKEANLTLNMLLVGGAGSLGFVAVRIHENQPEVFAAILVSIWLFCLAASVIIRVQKLENFPAVYNSPENLLSAPDWDYERLLTAELHGMQDRIDEATVINTNRSNILNGIRKAVCFTPLIAIAAYLIASRLM